MSISNGTSSVDKCVQAPLQNAMSSNFGVEAPELMEDASRLLGIIDNDRQGKGIVESDKCVKAMDTSFEPIPTRTQRRYHGMASEYYSADNTRRSDIQEELEADPSVQKLNSACFQNQQHDTDEIWDSYMPPLTYHDGFKEEKGHRHLDDYVNNILLPFLPYLEKLSNLPQLPSYSHSKPGWECIDLCKIRNWINICNIQHYNHCQYIQSGDETAAKPLWLVDVVRSCLVPAMRGSRYVALSYVWGSTEATSSTLASLGNLQKYGSLLDKQVVLPRTVRHAICLTQMLGQNYLWIDRLCIVQDADEIKAQQINCMAMIYASSYFTIVAAQGDNADDGLQGIQGVTPRRHLGGQNPLKYLDHYEAFSFQSRQLKGTNWHKRGWTFQEHLFSRRKLIFQNDTVNWECHCSAWYENQEMPVSLYNERFLSFPKDVLDAFTGVTTALGPNFEGGFLSGLSQMFFDTALLWQPYQPLVRRQGLRTSKNIPSWSWIGWKGDLHSESWRSGHDYIKVSSDDPVKSSEWSGSDRKRTSWQTNSTVHWHYSEDRESQQYPGWGRHHDDDTEYYKHVLDANQEFWYPIPLPGSFTACPPLVQPAFLHGRTHVCSSLLFGASFTNPETSRCLSYDLVDAGQRWVGTLLLNIRASAKSVDKQTGSGCTLVEISSGSVYNWLYESISFDEWYRPECPRRDGFYEFYNVLQVQMVEGVAYRMALGRVVKNVWDELAEAIDICLG
ncbi:hypothetical protein IFR05_003914 [Cadophora sp. M221]|nr:hypothetical protein IFR05_003914 [Cadophora sp. M221]